VTATDLALSLGLPLEGPPGALTGAAPLESATASELSFVSGEAFFAAGRASNAGCLIAPLGFQPRDSQSVIRSQSPRGTFARALALLYPERPAVAGIHPSAVIEAGAVIDSQAEIGAFCSVGAGSSVGSQTRFAAGVHVGKDCRIGAHCTLHSGVVIYDRTRVGDRVVLHAGCVVGADGFGFAPQDGKWVKFPQVGYVSIEDDVEIGANSCVDRAALGVTRIGGGTKLDNMVHVGHNCDIGRNVVVAAQTGFSGGVTVGDGAIIGGQVGVGDKARIEAGAVIGSGSGILPSKIVRAGQPQWGTPAQPLREYLKQLAWVRRLARKSGE
jgi:UDP-3-O-[3-hydroxymyristoyl] glucosamine N-acyltransferase